MSSAASPMGERDPALGLVEGPEVRRHLAVPGTGVYVVRPDGHCVWASPSMLQVVGHGPAQLVGHNGWGVLVRPEDLPAVAEFRARLSDADGTVWMRLRTRPDDWFRVDTYLRPAGIVCAFRSEPDPARHRLHWLMHPRPGTS